MSRRRLAFGVVCALVVATAACGFSGLGQLTEAPATPGDASAESTPSGDGPAGGDAPGADAFAERFGAPMVVATGQFVLSDIACDEGAAFVAVVDTLERSVILRVAEGVPPAMLASNQYRGRSTAVDDTRVFWVSGEPTGGHSYVRSTLKNAVAAPEDYYDDGLGSSSFSALTIKGTVLAFFIETASGGRRIFRGSTSGLGGFDVATNTGTVEDVAIDGPYAYWLPAAGDVVMRSSKTDAGAAETFASGSGPAITSFAIANGEVFWTSDDGVLSAVGTATPNTLPRQVANGLAKPRALAIDSRRAFWVNRASGAIATVPLAGGAPVVIGTGDSSSAIAVCANAVWFTNPTSGEILRVARN